MLIGGLLPYLFGSMGMQAAGEDRGAVVVEVEDNLKNSGIMKEKESQTMVNL